MSSGGVSTGKPGLSPDPVAALLGPGERERPHSPGSGIGVGERNKSGGVTPAVNGRVFVRGGCGVAVGCWGQWGMLGTMGDAAAQRPHAGVRTPGAGADLGTRVASVPLAGAGHGMFFFPLPASSAVLGRIFACCFCCILGLFKLCSVLLSGTGVRAGCGVPHPAAPGWCGHAVSLPGCSEKSCSHQCPRVCPGLSFSAPVLPYFWRSRVVPSSQEQERGGLRCPWG